MAVPIYGTAEAVPFLQDRVLTQALKPLIPQPVKANLFQFVCD
jgi:hypothetical protein